MFQDPNKSSNCRIFRQLEPRWSTSRDGSSATARSPSPSLKIWELRVIRSSSHGKRHTFGSFTCGLSAMTSSWPELKRVAVAGVFPLSKFPKEVQPRIQLGCFSYLNKKVDSTDIKASVYCMILFYICVCNSMAMYLFLSNLEQLKMKQ